LARAAHGRRDPAWVADGVVTDRWAPLSPVTGRLDAFRWEVPPEVLTGPGPSVLDDVLADLDDKPVEPAPQLIPPSAEPVEPLEAHAVTADEPSMALVPEPQETASEPPAVEEPAPLPEEAAPTGSAQTPEPLAKPNGSGAAHVEPAPVIFPVPQAPDDPGPDEAESKRSRFRLLG
jgi:HemY protein